MVAVHAALGVAGGARGIGDGGQHIGLHHTRAGRQLQRQRCGKAMVGPSGQRQARRGHHLGQGIGRWGSGQCVAVGVDDHRIEQVLVHTGLGAGQQFLGDDGQAGAAVVGVVAQLGGGGHRAHRHHHAACAVDGIAGNDELRAVLALQQHALARCQLQALLHKTGQRIHLGQQLGIAGAGARINDGGLVRVALGRGAQVVVQGDAGYAQITRDPFGPVKGQRRACGGRGC